MTNPFQEALPQSDQPGGQGSTPKTPKEHLASNVNKQVLSELRAAAKELDQAPIIFEQVFEAENAAFWQDVDQYIFNYEGLINPTLRAQLGEDWEAHSEEFTTNPDSIGLVLNYARWWWGEKLPGVAQVWGGTSSTRGSGRSGPREPTEEEIRAKFDLDQLSARTDDLFRSYLLEESDDPRGLAKSYVDAIVKNPDQKLDFDEFILGNHIQSSSRYAMIYKNKPESMTEQEFLQPYFQVAKQTFRPDEAADRAIGAAQFGASGEQFQNRVQRSNEFRTSAPFINGLEGRMRSLKGVLKG